MAYAIKIIRDTINIAHIVLKEYKSKWNFLMEKINL